MCSMCRMDPAEMKVREQRQGAVEVDDFYNEMPHRKKRNGKPRKRNVCKIADDGIHVWVWVNLTPRNHFYDYFGFHKYEYKVCCGCEEKSNSMKSSRLTQEYRDRWGGCGKWNWNYPEYNDTGYSEYLDKQYSPERWLRYKLEIALRNP